MFTFNGTSSLGKLRVLKVTRSVLPPSQNRLLEIEGKSGAIFISKKHGVKVINVEVVVIGDTPEGLRDDVRDLADWLDTDKPEALVFSDEPDKTDFGIIDGETDLDEILDIGFGTITFLCPDSYSIGSAVTESLVAGPNTITNSGTAETFPEFTVTFSVAVTSFSISNGTETITINASMGTTSTLVINNETGKITINGVENQQIMTLDSDYISLKKGTNTLTVSSGASVSMKYTEKFK